MQHQTPQPWGVFPRLSDQCCGLSGQGEPTCRHTGMAHHITPMAVRLSQASATTPACPWLQGHTSLICPGVTTHCRQCPKPSVCSQGLRAGQCSPPCPPTHAPNQAKLSLPSCGLCQERKVPSCSPWVKGKCRLEGVWPWDRSGTTLCQSPAMEAMCAHSASAMRPGFMSCCYDSHNTWP